VTANILSAVAINTNTFGGINNNYEKNIANIGWAVFPCPYAGQFQENIFW
jgi:hypothetical protein